MTTTYSYAMLTLTESEADTLPEDVDTHISRVVAQQDWDPTTGRTVCVAVAAGVVLGVVQ